MPKIERFKVCYRSSDDSRRPTCRKFVAGLCSMCYQADLRYRARREEVLEARRERNRASAAKSRDNRDLSGDDLVAENYALLQEKYEAEKELYDIEVERRKLIAAIHGKKLERAWRVDCVASDVSRFILMNPDETIDYLCHTFGSPVPVRQGAPGGMPALEASSATNPAPLK